MTLSQPDEGSISSQDASERQNGEIVVPEEEKIMRTEKRIYYRRSRGGGRFYNWTRKVQKVATPLKRMWQKKKEEAVESECLDSIIVGEPLMAEPALTLNPMDYVSNVSNLSDANAYPVNNDRMAG